MKSMMSILLASLITFLASAMAVAAKPDHPLHVAFVVSQNFNMIDFAGPWEVFQDAGLDLYTVAATTDPLTSTGGATFVPRFTFATAPKPDIVVIGAQSDNSPVLLDWLRGQYAATTTLASVCTGARKLALTGLLDGKQATTHHDFITEFRDKYPKVHWLESRRFVRAGERLYTAGGTTSGIDLALHLVAQRFDRKTAQDVADFMEYRGTDWALPD